MRLEASIFSI